MNASLPLLKILAGTSGNSYALIADGIESTADIISSLIVWGGLLVAARLRLPGKPFDQAIPPRGGAEPGTKVQ